MDAEAMPKRVRLNEQTGASTEPQVEARDEMLPYDDLLRAYDEMRDANNRRALTLASAAHELKTPLAIMSGYLELLLSNKLGPLSEKQTQVLGAMQASSSRLQQFIQDFLTYCAFDTGKLSLDYQVGDLNECLRELYEIWLARFQNKGIAFYMPGGDPLPRFPFDGHKVQRVISTLLENAFLSTPSGGTVWLAAEPHSWERRTRQANDIEPDRRQQAVERPNAVRISVSDTGPGIAPEFHQEIFDDFVSLRHSETEPRGTGLGLAIARRLVLAQQGKIWVESECGAGSKFCFLLPLRPFEH
jgi:signal transduction histidine kinase